MQVRTKYCTATYVVASLDIPGYPLKLLNAYASNWSIHNWVEWSSTQNDAIRETWPRGYKT